MRCAALLFTLMLIGAAGTARSDDPPRDARQRLALAVERARTGEFVSAAAEFALLRQDGDHKVAVAATFDFARARFERAAGRSLPSSPSGSPSVTLIADARGLLGLIRSELEESRGALLDLVAAALPDRDVQAGLARVAELLRQVIARDREWAAVAEREAARAAHRGAKGPLKPGASGVRSQAGAPGKRVGGADAGGDPIPHDATAAAASPPAPLSTVATRELLDQLDRVRGEQRALDERHAQQALERGGARRQ